MRKFCCWSSWMSKKEEAVSMLMSDFFCSWDALENKWFLIQHNTFILIICAQSFSFKSRTGGLTAPSQKPRFFFVMSKGKGRGDFESGCRTCRFGLTSVCFVFHWPIFLGPWTTRVSATPLYWCWSCLRNPVRRSQPPHSLPTITHTNTHTHNHTLICCL